MPSSCNTCTMTRVPHIRSSSRCDVWTAGNSDEWHAHDMTHTCGTSFRGRDKLANRGGVLANLLDDDSSLPTSLIWLGAWVAVVNFATPMQRHARNPSASKPSAWHDRRIRRSHAYPGLVCAWGCLSSPGSLSLSILETFCLMCKACRSLLSGVLIPLYI